MANDPVTGVSSAIEAVANSMGKLFDLIPWFATEAKKKEWYEIETLYQQEKVKERRLPLTPESQASDTLMNLKDQREKFLMVFFNELNKAEKPK